MSEYAKIVGRKLRGVKRRVEGLSESKAWRTVRRMTCPISPKQLRASLASVIGEGADTLLVHSSLSSCGHFTAGPNDVLDALAETCRTLCLVTHTYCYPDIPGELGPVFDAHSTPSKNGILTNLFRGQAGVRRSIHATHSLAARGTSAAEVIEGHYRGDSPTGSGTPYLRLIARKASVLMFGVSFHYYTFFHSAEFDAESEHAYQAGITDRLRVIDEHGAVRECLSKRQNWSPMRFAEAGELLERKGLARKVALGREFLRFTPDSSKVHDFLVERLRRYPDFLRQSCVVDLH